MGRGLVYNPFISSEMLGGEVMGGKSPPFLGKVELPNLGAIPPRLDRGRQNERETWNAMLPSSGHSVDYTLDLTVTAKSLPLQFRLLTLRANKGSLRPSSPTLCSGQERKSWTRWPQIVSLKTSREEDGSTLLLLFKRSSLNDR